MSKISEMAEREAQRAEAEPDEEPEEEDSDVEPGSVPPEPEEEEEGEPEPGAEPGAPEQQATLEKLAKQIEGEAKRHRNALAKMMPAFEEAFADCPICNGMGYVAGPVHPLDPDREVCPQCVGTGGTTTGSLVPGHDVEQCTKCNGNGWIHKVPEPAPAPPAVPVTTAFNGNATTYIDPRVAELQKAGYVVVPPVSA